MANNEKFVSLLNVFIWVEYMSGLNLPMCYQSREMDYSNNFYYIDLYFVLLEFYTFKYSNHLVYFGYKLYGIDQIIQIYQIT